MSQQNIDFGAFPGDPDADAIRSAFQKVQNNFSELFNVSTGTITTITAGPGVQVNPPTGNVLISANIACVRVHTSSLSIGRGGNGSTDTTITNSNQLLVIDINPNNVFSNSFASVGNGLANLNGTLTINSNSQPNITSVGMLVDLSVGGIQVISSAGHWVGPQDGISGYSGKSGWSGTSGYSGTTGIDGTSGYSGVSGYSGTTGIDGTSGYSGVSGWSGTSGISGYSGTTGIDGTSGYSGVSGYSGTSGYSGVGTSGYSGVSGLGLSGYSGVSGDSTSGYSGVSGWSGTSGISGYSGISGWSGTPAGLGQSGYSGISGLGLSGYSGVSGDSTSGWSGVSGWSGTSGVSGWSGTSGVSGWSGTSGIGISGYSGIGISGYSGIGGTSVVLKGSVADFASLPGDALAGDLYIILAAGSGYNAGDGAVSDGTGGWSNVGKIQGPEGPQGISGYSGAGASGYSGMSGDSTSGYSGISGQSTSGYSGVSGEIGASGYSGVGTSGYSGIVGTSGYSGIDGVVGTSGYSGISGWSGTSGYSGISGWSGTSGYSGISGWSGTSGVSGWSGTSGVSGWSGTSGISGYSGISGWSGTSGISGYSGISGWSGTSGYSGVSGWSGTSGYSGVSGASTSGYSGASGTSGWSGTSGVSGWSGTSGISGYSGASGTSGYSGATGAGTSGYSGTIGASGYSGAAGGGGGVAVQPNIVTYGGTTGLYGNAAAGLTLVQTPGGISGQGTINGMISIPVSFPIQFLGTSYSSGNVYLTSNSFITFGPTPWIETPYPIGPGIVPMPALFLGGNRLSMLRYYYGYPTASPTTFVIGFEGIAGQAVAALTPSIIWELHVDSATPSIIKIVVGNAAGSLDGSTNYPAGIWGASDGTRWIEQFHPLPWTTNFDGTQFFEMTLAPVSPVAATNISFGGPGVTTTGSGADTFVNVDPLGQMINIAYRAGMYDACLSSTSNPLTISTSLFGDGLYLTPLGAVNINAYGINEHLPDGDGTGTGYKVEIYGGHISLDSSTGSGGNVDIGGGDGGVSGYPGYVNIMSDMMITRYTETVNIDPTPGTTFTVDTYLGPIHSFTTSGSTTITLPAAISGKSYMVSVTYGGTHPLAFTGGTTIKWSGGAQPTSTSVAGKTDIYLFTCIDTVTYGRTGGSHY